MHSPRNWVSRHDDRRASPLAFQNRHFGRFAWGRHGATFSKQPHYSFGRAYNPFFLVSFVHGYQASDWIYWVFFIFRHHSEQQPRARSSPFYFLSFNLIVTGSWGGLYLKFAFTAGTVWKYRRPLFLFFFFFITQEETAAMHTPARQKKTETETFFFSWLGIWGFPSHFLTPFFFGSRHFKEAGS